MNNARLREVFDHTLAWSAERNFTGYNKHDGLNSPLLSASLGWSRWTRIAAIQGVMRFPVNIRPLLGVRKAPNPKGLGLFLLGCIDAWQATGELHYLDTAKSIAKRLRELQLPTKYGRAWGYHYPWQDPGFFAPAGTPNAVVTSFVNESLLRLHEITGEERYLDHVGESLPFYLEELQRLKDTDEELCISYMPVPMRMRVMDVSILVGTVLAEYDRARNESKHAGTAFRLINYVSRQQTREGAWFYSDPPQDSRITHDNYHTGFILDALDRYRKAAGTTEFDECYDNGLAFYAEQLFEPSGAPRWMHDKRLPHDIHGAGQGILTFSRHLDNYPGLADRIAAWTLDHLYSGKGRFYYQQTRWMTKRFTLMRWCNGWMIRALGARLAAGIAREQ